MATIQRDGIKIGDTLRIKGDLLSLDVTDILPGGWFRGRLNGPGSLYAVADVHLDNIDSVG